MVVVKFYNGEKIIKGILLGKYCCPHDEVYSVEKKFLWKTKQVYKHRTLNTPLYVIFIPWKHREKELTEVDEKYIVDPDTVGTDEAWIKEDFFSSERIGTYENHNYRESMEVNDFTGYKFMYDNNSFMINLRLREHWENLTILYKNMPEILNIDLNNKEE